MAKNVLKLRYGTLLLHILCTASVVAQSVEEATNRLIVDIISQDTVPSENILRSIHSKIEKGLLTVQDSVKYVYTIKDRNLLLINIRKI